MFYYFFFSPLFPSLRPIKLSFQMPSHSVTPSPWSPPPKRGKNVLWMLNQEYEDPYCGRVTRSSISFSLWDCHRVIISRTHSQGFRCSSLDMHSIALNFGACSSEVMIYSERKIKRGGGWNAALKPLKSAVTTRIFHSICHVDLPALP